MRIQIISRYKPLTCDETPIKTLESLLQKSNSVGLLALTYAKEIDPSADVYLEAISTQTLKVGVVPDWIVNHKVPIIQFNHLHWVTIEDQTSEALDLISKFLLFIIGMVCIPAQWGDFMTDWADVRVALQYGNQAKYISSNELNSYIWPMASIASSVMLLNGDSTINKKFEIAADLIPHIYINQDYLNICNLTNTNHLAKTNTLLLLYKNLL